MAGLKKDCRDRKVVLWTIIVTAVDVSKAKGLKWLKQNIFSPTDQKQEYNLIMDFYVRWYEGDNTMPKF